MFPRPKFISHRSSDVGQHRKYLRQMEIYFICFSLQSFTALVSSSTFFQMETTISENSQARNQGGASPPLQNCSPPLEKCVGHNLKILDIVQKIWASPGKLFAPPGVPSWLGGWEQYWDACSNHFLKEPPSSDCLEQLCPTDKHKNYVTIFMRAAHWMTYFHFTKSSLV